MRCPSSLFEPVSEQPWHTLARTLCAVLEAFTSTVHALIQTIKKPHCALLVNLAVFVLATPSWAAPAPTALPVATPSPECGDMVIVRKAFTTGIRDREPSDGLTHFPPDLHSVYFFTEVHHARGQTLIHRWTYQGEVAAEVPLKIGGDRWRTWSSKVLGMRHTHPWQVELVTPNGCVMDSLTLLPDPGAADVLASARQQLAEGDWPGAKMSALTLLEQPDLSASHARAVHTFLNIDLELARIRDAIQTQQLYLAASRMDRLQHIQASPAKQAEISAVADSLHQATEQLNHQTHRTVAALEYTLSDTLNGGAACPTSEQQATALLALPERLPFLQLTDYTFENTQQQGQATLLDTRTGTLHRLTLYCRTPGTLPPEVD